MNKTHVKAHGKRQGRENKISKYFAKSNNHPMSHRTSSTRNDYEGKINYDWPNLPLPKSQCNEKLGQFFMLLCNVYIVNSFVTEVPII